MFLDVRICTFGLEDLTFVPQILFFLVISSFFFLSYIVCVWALGWILSVGLVCRALRLGVVCPSQSETAVFFFSMYLMLPKGHHLYNE